MNERFPFLSEGYSLERSRVAFVLAQMDDCSSVESWLASWFTSTTLGSVRMRTSYEEACKLDD